MESRVERFFFPLYVRRSTFHTSAPPVRCFISLHPLPPPPPLHASICTFDVGRFHFPRRRSAPLCSLCRIHLFKSFKSQLLSVHTMAHCPPAQESHCPLHYSDKGTWMSTPTALQRQRRRIIMSGHGRLVKGERSEVRDGAAIKGVSSVNTFVYSRKSPSISHGDVLSSGHVNHTVHGN